MFPPRFTNSAFPFRLTSLAARLILPVICLSTFSLAFADPPATQPQDDSLAKTLALCKQLIDHGKQRDAFPQLSRLHDAMDPKNPNPQVQALMARTALLEGRADMAAQFIDPWSEHPPTLHPELTTAYLAACDTMLAQGKAEKALPFFNWIASNVDSGSDPEDMALATEGYGISSARLRDIDEAIRALEFALTTAKTLPDPKGNDKWLIDRITAELAQLRPLGHFKPSQQSQDADKYGPDFVMFRDAETQRRQKQDYAKADADYCALTKKFPDSPYVEPSVLYDALCYSGVGKQDAAEKQLIAFCKQYPNSLYFGEALLELGRIQMEYHLDPKAAQDYFVHLDAWIESARKPDAPQQELKVRDAAKEVTSPPQDQYKSPDYFGNVLKEKIQPGQLVNAKTAPWYLDDLAAQCAKMEGFILFSQGKKDEALKAYNKVLQLDPQIASEQATGQWNDFARLKWGIDHGYLVAYPQDLKLYNDRQRFVIMIGDFYQVTQQWDNAAAIFQRLLHGQFGQLDGPQQDYPHFALGSCFYYRDWKSGDFSTRNAAAAQFETVVDARHGTWTTDRAASAFANVGGESDDPKMQARANYVLQQLADSGVKNEFVYSARINLANKLIALGRKQEGLARLAQFVPEDKAAYDIAQYLIRQYAQDAATSAKDTTTQPIGKE